MIPENMIIKNRLKRGMDLSSTEVCGGVTFSKVTLAHKDDKQPGL